MLRHAGPASGADKARVIDLGRDTATGFGPADELVAEDASEPHVAAGQLQVGLADPRGEDAEPHLARPRLGLGQVAPEPGRGTVTIEAPHRHLASGEGRSADRRRGLARSLREPGLVIRLETL